MVVALGYSETHGENGERDMDAPEEEPLERAVFVESVEDTYLRWMMDATERSGLKV